MSETVSARVPCTDAAKVSRLPSRSQWYRRRKPPSAAGLTVSVTQRASISSIKRAMAFTSIPGASTQRPSPRTSHGSVTPSLARISSGPIALPFHLRVAAETLLEQQLRASPPTAVAQLDALAELASAVLVGEVELPLVGPARWRAGPTSGCLPSPTR